MHSTKNANGNESFLSRNRAVFDWCVRSANRELDAGRPRRAVEWCSLAAFLAQGPGWFGFLADAGLEEVLRRVAAGLPAPRFQAREKHPRRWLHVMTEAWFWGGMVENVKKWIRFTRDKAVNDLVVYAQKRRDWTDSLRAEVEANGGKFILMEGQVTPLEKALALRRLAASEADAVLLHTIVHDIVPALAFGVPGGPPILRMNHDDHMFWTGACAIDCVVDFRELGKRWTFEHRGLDRSFILPLPMEEILKDPSADKSELARRAVRERFGIPHDAIVLLAVGSGYKFNPFEQWDFLDAADAILARCPDAFILGVGMEHKGRWCAVSNAHQGRLKALGVQTDMTDCLLASDIGLGSIPFPSQTAILEVALVGRPCVLTPRDVPMGINDVAFDEFSQPADMHEYIAMAAGLVVDKGRRLSEGALLAESARRHHGKEAWIAAFEEMVHRLPPTHEIYPLNRLMPMSASQTRYWAYRMNPQGHEALRHVHYDIIAKNRKISPIMDALLANALGVPRGLRTLSTLIYYQRSVRFHFGMLRRRLSGQSKAIALASSPKV